MLQLHNLARSTMLPPRVSVYDRTINILPTFDESLSQVRRWIAEHPMPSRQSGRDYRSRLMSACASAHYVLSCSVEGRSFLHQVAPRTQESKLKWSADNIRQLVLADPTMTRTKLHNKHLGAYFAVKDRYPGLLDELLPHPVRAPGPPRLPRAKAREDARLKERARLAKLARDATPSWV